MSTGEQQPPTEIARIAAAVQPAGDKSMDGFSMGAEESQSEKIVDAIEMIGEETAAGFTPPEHSPVSPGMRYLHCSRTIHQLVTDRNRAVGIYLGVASLLLTASGALVHANPQGDLLVPIEQIQRWCLPITFGTLAVLAVLVAFLLIRTRVGLIYEAAKMNALLGLPIGRVQRVNVLSVSFILHVIISLAGGCATGLFSVFMLHLAGMTGHTVVPAFLIGGVVAAALLVVYIETVKRITSDERLKKLDKT